MDSQAVETCKNDYKSLLFKRKPELKSRGWSKEKE